MNEDTNTGNQGSGRLHQLEIARDEDLQWVWRFIAANGRELARSSETYRRRRDCERSSQIVLRLDQTQVLTDGVVLTGERGQIQVRVIA